MKKILLLLCMATFSLLTSCIYEDVEECPHDSETALAMFRHYFFDENMAPKLVPMDEGDDGAWVIGVGSGEVVCRVFSEITGMETNPEGAYHYEYQSSDRRVSLSVDGSLTENEDAVYATMKVEIPEYPEIKKIHLVNREYFNGANSGTVITVII